MDATSELITKLKFDNRIIRIVIVGDGAVGKTTLVWAILQKLQAASGKKVKKLGEIKRTPFMEIETWQQEGLLIQCYDLAGQKRPGVHPLDLLANQVLAYVDIIIFVFALNEYESFENLNTWKEDIYTAVSLDEAPPIKILVGNKADLEHNISNDLIQSTVGENKPFLNYTETTAVKGDGIEDLLQNILKATEIALEK
ncbi:MAG: GTPase domain-containing protein [Candidatus Hodarchaeota archaeon]